MRASGLVVAMVGLVGAVGCSPVTQQPDAPGPGSDADVGPDLNEGATSGTRLKLRYFDFGSVRQLVGVRDTQRNEDCMPTDWADGKAYCVPSNTGSTVYSNATCTQRIGEAYVQAGCTRSAPTYFVDYEYQACNGKTAHLYPRGTRIAVTQYWYKSSDGTCDGPYTSQSSEYYALGTEIPVTDLAATPITAPSTTGRLGQRHYESADGLRYPLSYRLHDALLGGDCYPTYDTPGATTGRCIPSNVASMFYFRDATCTQSTATTSSTCPAPFVAADYGDCPYDPTKYYAVTGLQNPTTIYYESGGTCSATSPSTYNKYYGVGSELTLATTARVKGTGSGRLQPIHYTTPEGLANRDYTLYDQQIGTECYARTQSDGSVACVPAANGTQTLYTDAACANPLELMTVYRGEPTCSPPPLPSYAIKYNLTPTCSYNHEVHRVGALYTGTLYEKDGATCSAFTSTSQVYYRIQGIVPQNELAAGMLVTEP
jgi:hypothetical protein